MKKTSFILLLFLSVSIAAETSGLYKSLEVGYWTLNLADTFSTYLALDSGSIEANPVMSRVIDNKPLTIALTFGVNLMVTKYCRNLYKKKKWLGITAMIGLNFLYGYVVYNNFQKVNL